MQVEDVALMYAKLRLPDQDLPMCSWSFCNVGWFHVKYHWPDPYNDLVWSYVHTLFIPGLCMGQMQM